MFFLFFRIRGTCKHVAALFHHILHKVAKGENISLTSLHQSWDKSSSKLHQPDFIENIKKLQGDCIIEELISSTHSVLTQDRLHFVTTRTFHHMTSTASPKHQDKAPSSSMHHVSLIQTSFLLISTTYGMKRSPPLPLIHLNI